MIKGFFGEYKWLSNFWSANVVLTVDTKELWFPSVEHAYVFMKHVPDNILDFYTSSFLKLTSGQVKRYGRSIILRDDFDYIKKDVMSQCIGSKFSDLNPELVKLLVNTGDKYIEETNNWGDTYWGVNLQGVGDNRLGKIIMQRRSFLL